MVTQFLWWRRLSLWTMFDSQVQHWHACLILIISGCGYERMSGCVCVSGLASHSHIGFWNAEWGSEQSGGRRSKRQQESNEEEFCWSWRPQHITWRANRMPDVAKAAKELERALKYEDKTILGLKLQVSKWIFFIENCGSLSFVRLTYKAILTWDSRVNTDEKGLFVSQSLINHEKYF